MPTQEQVRRQSIIKELYVGLIGWIWISAGLAALYLLTKATFFGGSWWPVVASVAATALLYKVSLYYMLEKSKSFAAREGELSSATMAEKLSVAATVSYSGVGTTRQNAIQIRAANSLEGIPKEYAALNAMFGAQNEDWKLLERSVLLDGDRKLDRFVISASGKNQEVYFDVTEWFRGNTSEEAKATLDAIIAPHDKPLMIVLPKEEFMTLQMGVLHLTDSQINQLGLSEMDRKHMLDPLLDALRPWLGTEYDSIPEYVRVTMATSVWSKILGLLKFWHPADGLQEQELKNLRAIISATMKTALGASTRI